MPELYPFQRSGRDWLVSHRRGYLADMMGLGKTPQAVTALVQVGATHPLVLCPANARHVWQRTFATWAPASMAPEIVSYGEAANRPLSHLVALDADALVLDEAHYLKNHKAKRTRIALTYANRAPGLRALWALSGTPMPNGRPTELYPLLRAVWPDLLRERGVLEFFAFLRRYCYYEPGDYGLRILGPRNVPEFRELLRPLLLRRTHEDAALELPPLRWEAMPVEATWDAFLDAKKYAHLRPYLEAGELPPESPELATLRREIGACKVYQVATQIAEELEDGALGKVVVLAYHRDVLDVLGEKLGRFGTVRVDGSTPTNERATAEQLFQHSPGVRVFLGQLTAAGVSITLTAAHEMVQVEQSWNPGENIQAAYRILRIGQEHPCRVRQAVLHDTIDDAVVGVLRRKLRGLGEILHE